MKQIILLILTTLFACSSIVGQTINHKIVEEGKVWSYKGSRLIAPTAYQAEWDEIYSLEGDTVIDSRQCLKLYITNNGPYAPHDHSYFGAMYEEGECVYYIAQGKDKPSLLYNFSCESGTTIKVNNFNLTVNIRKLVKYRGEYLTVIDWSPIEEEETFYHGIWIEGIGSPLDLINNTPIWYDGCPYKELVTCKLNDRLIYDKDEFKTSALFITDTPVTFTQNQMATIILPTEPDASKGKYYRLDRVEGNEIIFEQELHPRAHVPYIIVPGEDFSIEVDAMELDGLRCDTASVEGISFIGTFQKEEVESQEGFYIKLIDTTPDCSLSPSGEAGREVYTIGTLRAYLLVHWDDPYSHGGTKTPAEKIEIVLHDDATGIESIQNSKFKVQNEDAAIYDVSGKPVNRKSLSHKSTRGIYIKDGKKVAFKQE